MQARNCNPGSGLETNQSTAQNFAVLALILVIGGPKGSTEEGKKHRFCVPFVVHEPRYAAFVLSPTGVHNFSPDPKHPASDATKPEGEEQHHIDAGPAHNTVKLRGMKLKPNWAVENDRCLPRHRQPCNSRSSHAGGGKQF